MNGPTLAAVVNARSKAAAAYDPVLTKSVASQLYKVGVVFYISIWMFCLVVSS